MLLYDDFDDMERSLILRPENFIVFPGICLVLLLTGNYLTLLVYVYWAITLVTVNEDDEQDQDTEVDLYGEFTKERGLYSPEVRAGLEFADFELAELFERVVEDPILIDDYLPIKQYKLDMAALLTEKSNALLTEKLNTKYGYLFFCSGPSEVSLVRPLMQLHLPRSECFKLAYGVLKVKKKQVDLKVMKYRLMSLTLEKHLVQSQIALGVFGKHEYDFELFVYFDKIIFDEYPLIENYFIYLMERKLSFKDTIPLKRESDKDTLEWKHGEEVKTSFKFKNLKHIFAYAKWNEDEFVENIYSWDKKKSIRRIKT